MDSLNELLKYKKHIYENKMWNIIFDIGWGIKTKNYKNIRREIKDKYTLNEIFKLKEFSKIKKIELQIRLKEYELQVGQYNYYNVSDDGFWDLTAHIVGLGKHIYYSVMNDPEIAKSIADNYMYVENFEYIFNDFVV